MINNVLTQHFGFVKEPFDRSIQPDELFEFASFCELNARLGYLIDHKGMGLLTGEVGSGKTTAVRRVLQSLHPGTHKPVYIVPSSLNINDLYRSLAIALDLTPLYTRARLVAQLRGEIERLVYSKKLHPVFAIDEAHLLRPDVLDEIRFLTNSAMDSASIVTIILIGQTDFRRKMSLSIHEAFAQRLLIRYHLDGLKRTEINDYVTHQLRRSGVHIPLFTDAALDAIFQASRGTLRLINHLCIHSLLAASMQRKPQADADHVRIAVAETA